MVVESAQAHITRAFRKLATYLSNAHIVDEVVKNKLHIGRRNSLHNREFICTRARQQHAILMGTNLSCCSISNFLARWHRHSDIPRYKPLEF